MSNITVGEPRRGHPKELFTKMNEVMKKVAYIQRDAKNEHDRYTYASERAIKEALHEALTEVGLIFQLNTSNPRVLKSEAIDAKGNVTWRNVTWIDVVYRFIDIDTGDFLEGTFLGSGSARDEKGHYAAVTGAVKYILTSSFLIPTGDDAEADEDPANENVAKPTGRNLKRQRDTREPYPEAGPDEYENEPPPRGERSAPPRRTAPRSAPATPPRRTDSSGGGAPTPPISEAQSKFLAVLVKKKLDVAGNRDEVHDWMTGVLGKEVKSQKNLTKLDAMKLIDKLQAMPDLEPAEEDEDDLPF